MKTLFDIVDRAIAAGMLPAQASSAVREKDSSQPWPVVLVGFIGAQFAVWPLLVFIAFVGEGFMIKGIGPYLVGLILIAASWAVLRAKDTPGFVSHMAFTILLVGDALLVYALGRDAWREAPLIAGLLMAALQLALAFLLQLRWAQVVLGAMACSTFIFAYGFLMDRQPDTFFARWWFIALLVSAAAWATAVLTEHRWSTKPYALTLHSSVTGWGCAVLLAVFFMSGTHLSSFGGGIFGFDLHNLNMSAPAFLSVLLTLASGAALLRSWRASLSVAGRNLVVLGFAALAVMTWFVPYVEIVAIILVATLLTQRHRMVGFALLVLLCMLSGFYYSLSITLVNKALLVMATGTALLAGTLLIARFSKKPAAADAQKPLPVHTWALGVPLILAGAVLTLGAANYSIVQKERVISQGQKVYVALAPRDPRSLMQGDYMALNFGMPGDVVKALGGDTRWWREENNQKPMNRRNTVVAKLDARGVATVLRVAADKEAVAANELLLPVQFKGGRWALVTDAFFFPEGAGKSLEGAKFGELRTLGNGQALLVGLADADLKPLQSLPDTKFDQERAAERVEEVPTSPSPSPSASIPATK